MTGQELVQAQRELVAFADEPRLKQELAEVLPPSVTVPVFIRGLKNAAMAQPDVLKAEQSSLYRAVLRCAMDGLIPDGQEATIQAFYDKGKQQHVATYMPMIGGLRKKLAEFGWTLTAHVVRENDEFDPDYEAHRTNHRRARLGTDPGEIIGAYAIAEHRDGRKVGPEVMDKAQIEHVRQQAKSKDSPAWRTWWDRMAEKTVAKKLTKSIPLDPKDRETITRVLSVDEPDDPVAALYGRSEHRALEAAPNPPRASDPAGEAPSPAASPAPPDDAKPADQPEPAASVADQADDDLGEPSDEQLDAGTIDGEATEVLTFDRGKYEGKTIAEVFESGERGVNYLKWAAAKWPGDEMRVAIADFAKDHPELREE